MHFDDLGKTTETDYMVVAGSRDLTPINTLEHAVAVRMPVRERADGDPSDKVFRSLLYPVIISLSQDFATTHAGA
jgi:hypothetical protein